ncbi:Peptidase S1 family protein [Candidatus Promineifilum breve]|uniref:Peptidase S1 family protein n=1 Tax=Candidatus Promineifilum breve TaxID=1806508 RepID=A0A160T2K2_9CHLR|nr:trypsin-like peptidase domain-containing protein [Candidatus Promineifilum breve]CUS04166.2 Peptidase S1 family protein [Candidatus Promineifilum breve]
MKRVRPLSLIVIFVLFAALLIACGGGGEEPTTEVTIEPAATVAQAEPTQAPEPTAEPVAEPTAEPTASGPTAMSTFQDAIQATIQIEAEGSFMDPEFGMQLNTAGRGSGFIIDPSGIAVTNNHVVTGSAFLQVFVQGQDEPLNARVLGVSECSDLAVIDIEGEGYPFLDWNTAPVSLGTEVYALGYPLGDPEPSLTRGVISKEEADGETSWASVDQVLEHDATINPGNSGGPLVTADGKVVGVNYAGASDVSQYFAINAADARTIVEQLRGGVDMETIGINGEAVITADGDTGIWVASVASGSPADRVGVEAGDIITKLEGLVLSLDGTMADYCDILRSREATDPMAIEVLRFATQEVLEGQLNGPELEQSFSFAQAVEVAEEPAAGGDTGGDTGGTTYTEFVGIYDDSNAVYVEVPVEWVEVDGSNWLDEDDGTVLGSQLIAAPNINEFSTTFTTPGVQILAGAYFGDITMGELVDFFDFSTDCTLEGRFDYEDPIYTGVYDLYSDCAGEGSVIIVLGAEPAARNYSVIVLVQAVTDADLDAMDHILNTFNIVGTLPGQ